MKNFHTEFGFTDSPYFFDMIIESVPAFMNAVMVEPRGSEIPAHLNRTHFRTLFLIRRCQGEPMKAIARRLNLEKGSFTTTARTLEKKGLVKRLPDPSDRRSFILRNTEDGNKVLDDRIQAMRLSVESRLDSIDPDRLNELKKALGILAGITDALVQKTREPS